MLRYPGHETYAIKSCIQGMEAAKERHLWKFTGIEPCKPFENEVLTSWFFVCPDRFQSYLGQIPQLCSYSFLCFFFFNLFFFHTIQWVNTPSFSILLFLLVVSDSSFSFSFLMCTMYVDLLPCLSLLIDISLTRWYLIQRVQKYRILNIISC